MTKAALWAGYSVSQTNKAPSHAEVLMLDSFKIRKNQPSTFAPGQNHEKVIGMTCPCCNYLGQEAAHWSKFECPACGLSMYVVGNALHIWRDEVATVTTSSFLDRYRLK